MWNVLKLKSAKCGLKTFPNISPMWQLFLCREFSNAYVPPPKTTFSKLRNTSVKYSPVWDLDNHHQISTNPLPISPLSCRPTTEVIETMGLTDQSSFIKKTSFLLLYRLYHRKMFSEKLHSTRDNIDFGQLENYTQLLINDGFKINFDCWTKNRLSLLVLREIWWFVAWRSIF